MTDIEQQTGTIYSQDPNSPVSNTPRKGGAKLAIGFAVIALLLACGSVAYSVLRANQLTTAWQQQNANNTAQTADLLQQVQTTVTSTQQQLTQQLGQQQARITAQQKQIQQLLLAHNHAQSSWIIAEVDYLIQLANFNVIYQRNPATAVVLLKAADMTLNKINDPRFAAVHKAIASDTSALEAVAITNKTTILTQLQTLAGSIAQLTLISQSNAASATAPATASTVSAATAPVVAAPVKESFWKRAWENFKAQLEKIVVIHHSDTTLPPVLNHVAQAYMKQDLQILLTQTQLAVMQGNNDIYHMSLTQIQGIVDQYFNTRAPSTQQFLQTLQQLQDINLTPVLPQLTASQQAIAQASQLTDQSVNVASTSAITSPPPVVTSPPPAASVTPPVAAPVPPTAPAQAPMPTQPTQPSTPVAVPAPAPTPATPGPAAGSAPAPATPKNVAPPYAPHTPILPNSSNAFEAGHMSTETAT